MLQISEEGKKKRVPEEERGCSKWCETGEAKARECRVAIVRERERERERSYKERVGVVCRECVVCKKDSHSLGNILSFAKWIGHRERESPEFLCRMHHAESGNSLQQDTWHLLWVGPTL